MKMKNIALPEALKPKFLRVKWHLWRGNVERALLRLSQLAKEATTEKTLDKINDPLLQIRAALNSKGEWVNKWRTAILNAV